MELTAAIEALNSDESFQSWKSKNKESYLSHAFQMFDSEHKEWQLGYYQKKSGKIATFVVNSNEVTFRPEEEVFKHEEKEVRGVEFSENSLTVKEVIEKANLFQNKKFPKDKSMKVIALLQHIEPHGTVWNITYVTQAFNTLNMKINPSNGEVLDHKLSSIFSFRSKDAKEVA